VGGGSTVEVFAAYRRAVLTAPFRAATTVNLARRSLASALRAILGGTKNALVNFFKVPPPMVGQLASRRRPKFCPLTVDGQLTGECGQGWREETQKWGEVVKFAVVAYCVRFQVHANGDPGPQTAAD
jgi:hypothetical protein